MLEGDACLCWMACVCEHAFMYIGVCAHRTTVERSDVDSSFCEQNYSY